VPLPAVLDDAMTAEVGPQLRRLAADTAHDWIVLDAGAAKVICSAGLGMLAAVGLLARRRGARVEVVNCDPALAGLLRVTRLAVTTADHGGAADLGGASDWTPWWSGAAANA
jgi:anti-anti-sigma regulatory factor